MRGSAVTGNAELGVVIRTGDELTIRESLVADTLAAGDGSYGVGVACSASQAMTLSNSVVNSSRTAGVIVANGCAALLEQLLIDGVAPGSFYTYEGETLNIKETYDGIGDGIAMNDKASATLRDVLVRQAARGAVVIDSCDGTLERVRAEGLRFGLVMQSSPGVSWTEGANEFRGGDKDILSDGMLPVPGPPPMPED
ncbi:MAG: right-handed parallel beta-helix repeat-containing protein [Deltaproteobacteria bacterium]|nr:right-handed parallel beta-helix repeat-containing protein [Deltaproteobacteria bacterium]